MPTLRERLAAESDPKVREQIKIDALNERVDVLVGRTMSRGRFTLTLTDLSATSTPGGPVLVATVKIVNTNTGQDVTPDDLNPIMISNLPIFVPDPTGEINLGDEEHPNRVREDIVESLLTTLRDLFRSRVG